MNIKDALQPYTKKNDAIGLTSYFGSFAVFFLALWLTITNSGTWYLAAPLVVITAFAGVRLYVLQHDCGHHSLFAKKWMNEVAGICLSPFTLTPFRAMQYNHNMHHAYLGNLEHRDTTEIHTMTLREWNEGSFWKRLQYRLYRNPLVLLPVGGAFVYFLRYRWPKNTLSVGMLGVLAHNLMVAAFVGVLYILFGWIGPIMLAIIALVSGMIGVFLVYLQHNFEDTYWDRKPDLDIRQAALQGSSALDLGWWFDIGTCNIAYHDIHHYNPSIPSYNLRHCHRAIRDEYHQPVIRWPEAIASFRLKLWDEDGEKLVRFPRARQEHAVPAE